MVTTEVKVGQIWKDCDHRRENRFILVTEVGLWLATCRNLKTGKNSRVKKARMTPTSNGFCVALNPEWLQQIATQLNLNDKKEVNVPFLTVK